MPAIQQWNRSYRYYNRFNDAVAAILQHDSIRKGFIPSAKQIDLFILALYNIDTFREMVLNDQLEYSHSYARLRKSALKNDEEMLLFGIDWLAATLCTILTCHSLFQHPLNISSMLKLIVFDCDGVMFDSKKANCMYYNHLLTHFGLAPMSESEENYVHMSNVTDSVQHIFRHHTSPTLEEVHAFRQSCDYAPFLQYMEIEDDLVDFLEITSKKYHLAISTNRTDTMIPLLKSYKLEALFRQGGNSSNSQDDPNPHRMGFLKFLTITTVNQKKLFSLAILSLMKQHANSCQCTVDCL